MRNAPFSDPLCFQRKRIDDDWANIIYCINHVIFRQVPSLKFRLDTSSKWSPAGNQSGNRRGKWDDPAANQLDSRWLKQAGTRLGNTYNFQLVTSWRVEWGRPAEIPPCHQLCPAVGEWKCLDHLEGSLLLPFLCNFLDRCQSRIKHPKSMVIKSI